MTGGSWLCLLAPLVATILILLGGSWLPRVAAAWIATTSVFVAFGGAIWAFFGVHAAAPRHGADVCLGTACVAARSRPRGRGSSRATSASACSCSSTR